MPDPRRWYLRICPCDSSVTTAGTQCAGFPGAWNDDKVDFDRSACLGEIVEVVEVVHPSRETDLTKEADHG